MKVKEESTKAELQLNMKTNVITTEELHNFNADNEEIEMVKDFIYHGSIIIPNGDCNQEIRSLRLGRAAMKELGKIIKYKDVSLETKIFVP